jgi:hypothetical protein
MKNKSAPSHDKYSSEYFHFSSSLISLFGKLHLVSSWEVAYLKLEDVLEIDLMVAFLVASHSSASSSMCKISHDALQSCT